MQVHGHRHQGKDEGHDDAEPGSEGLNERGVFLVVPAHGLKCRLKSVHQVVGQGNHAKAVNDHYPKHGESGFHFIEQGGAASGDLIGETACNPEMAQVDDQEHQQERSKKAHAAGVPCTAHTAGLYGISGWAGLAIVGYEAKALKDVNEQSEEQNDLHGTDKDVLAHEFRCLIEQFTAVVHKDHGIDGTMHDKENDEEKSGKAHDNFPADGRIG